MGGKLAQKVDGAPIRWKPIPLSADDEVVLFVTFNQHNIVPEHTRDYLRCLKNNGLKVILIRVLMDFANPPEDQVDFVDATILRANQGYDFAAWAHVLHLLPSLWQTKLIIIANDSLYGPLNEDHFKDIIAKVRASKADYVGLTDTHTSQYHFQSYFTVMKPSARAVPVFQEFWGNIESLSDKFEIIAAYEVSAVGFYLSKGLTCEALFPVREWGRKYSYNEYNPTIEWWRQTYGIGFPFIKVELLRDFLSVKEWEPYLESSGYDLGKIHRHLNSYPNYQPTKIKKEKKSHLLKDVERYVRKGIKGLKPSTLLPTILIPFPWAQRSAAPASQLAVIIHIYYVDLAEEILSFLGNIPFEFQLYISTDTKEKAEHLNGVVKGRHSCEIRLAPNRGRDIAPKLITFSDVYKKHDLFLHVHGKKTIYNKEFGQHWRTNLLHVLLGSEEIVRSNLELLSRKDIGVVYPRYFSKFPLSSRWSGNFTDTQFLLKELGLSIDRRRYFDFPAGSMFWGKSEAIMPLVDLNLSFDDFPDEMGQPDGTLAHAIERSILLVAEKQGYFGQQIALKSLKLPGYKFIEAKNEAELDEAIKRSRRIIDQMERGLVKRIL